MDTTLLLRLSISFVIGGAWVTMITLATIRYGARLGGLLAGFPSIVAFSLAFIGWTESTQAAVQATTALPLALGFTATFPLVYAFAAGRVRFGFSLLAALTFWAASSFVLTEVDLRFGLSIWVSLAGFYVISGAAYYSLGTRQRLAIASHGVRPKPLQWASRFVLAGSIIVCSVLLSDTLGPVVGGIFSSFPGITTSTVYIISRVEGVEASRAIATPLMVTTVFTTVPYVIVVRYAFPLVGIAWGTLSGYAVAIPLSVAAFYVMSRVSAN